MFRSWSIVRPAAAVAVGAVWVGGCTPQGGSSRVKPAIEPISTTKPAPQTTNDDSVAVANGMVRGSLYVPTGTADGSVLLLEKSLPSTVTSGRAFGYALKVTNVSKLKLEAVEIEETYPASLQIADANPTGKGDEPRTSKIWVGTLAAGESKSFDRSATPSGAGSLGMCMSASYSTSLCMATSVVSPSLKLMASAPGEALLCEGIPYKITVSNSGSGMARSIRASVPLPTGLTTQEGKTSIAFDAGDLSAGQSREFSFNAKAAKTGKYTVTPVVTAADGLTGEASAIDTTVKAPVLTIAKSGTEKAFIGQPIAYELTVANTGDAPATDTVLYDNIPDGATVQGMSEAGKPDGKDKVKWELGTIAPGASKKVSIVLTVPAAGEIKTAASASSKCTEPVAAMASTSVTGVPAILIEVTDQPDPIRVGSETTYLIEITNQGSAPGTNVKLVVEMEDSMQYVKATGPTPSNMDGNKISFTPIPSLAPKAKATYNVTIRGKKPADARFKAMLTSDQLGRPVEENEATTIYQ